MSSHLVEPPPPLHNNNNNCEENEQSLPPPAGLNIRRRSCRRREGSRGFEEKCGLGIRLVQ
ncbi:BNIP3L isoform 4 [Pan troglodytes]|uniref:BCL2 interacting protein 3 like n=2 Tax=Homininae TaxID=207598 RepID=E5RFE9_HUMAN|nr:BCL2 interacting protein 3 like [Homo sapiens]KAI4010015.1 BCL2 interacting protein 3 like [Homo sapiens]PNI68163.1 BNIP3L isoform 4 [Pan troglodytes]